MIEFRSVRFDVGVGHGSAEYKLNCRLVTNRRLGIHVTSAAARRELVNVICGVERPRTGFVRREARVSFPVGHASGLQAKVSVRSNVQALAVLFNTQVAELLQIVEKLIGKQYMNLDVADLPMSIRAQVAFSLSFGIPFDVYVANSVLFTNEEPFRSLLIDLIKARLRSSGLVLISGSWRAISTYCDCALSLTQSGFKSYSSMEEATASMRAVEVRIGSSPDLG